ncbi:hypothetical protein PHYBOEH_001422 [Phytophthora boehmeriae]|uniref:Transmembrane protein n=1 Tax=Phytophthora boehmeriae TaxID=109152 RepID=A0A8T1XDH2_9STRA|nr:hypothetical protein PHYBOEH_001422 [Phytophthora boehmeriae]
MHRFRFKLKSLILWVAVPIIAVTNLAIVYGDEITMPYAATPDTSSIDPDYHYQVTIESYSARLLYLADYDLGSDGSFSIALSLILPITKPKIDTGRTMLYLLACGENATQAFLNLPSTETSLSSIQIPPYCTMPSRTLDYYCESYPLEDNSGDDFIYRSSKIVTGSVDNMNRSAAHSGNGSNVNKVFFFIDACETLGGKEGILRSCLEKPPGLKQNFADKNYGVNDPPCFYCPNNYLPSYSSEIGAIAAAEGCGISPSLPPTLHGVVAMNLCNAQGNCLGKKTSLQSLFYGISALVWGITSFVWIVHIRAAARDAVVELQHKMKLIPIAQVCSSVLIFLDLYTDDKLVGTARSLVGNLAVFAQVVALAVFAEVIVFIAKGWKITRPSLAPRELQWIRLVTMSWAASFVVLENSDGKQLAVVVVWGLSWASVVFMVWYNSAFNLNMLKYQLAMVRQLDVDPRFTPVFTKFMLFRRFRGLLAGYIFFSCIFGIAQLVSDASHHSSEWVSLVANELLTWILFVALGYTFRCRRFGRLIQAAANGQNQAVANATNPINQGPAHRGSIVPEPAPVEPVVPPKRQKTIVVLNPDQAPWLATTTANEPADKPSAAPKSTS